jgi:hypothetical protein
MKGCEAWTIAFRQNGASSSRVQDWEHSRKAQRKLGAMGLL